jgi:hypothetical protein
VLLNGSVDNINTFKVLGAFEFPLGGLDRCLGAILSKIPKEKKKKKRERPLARVDQGTEMISVRPLLERFQDF